MKAIVYFTKTIHNLKGESVDLEITSEFNDIGEAEDIAHSIEKGVFDNEHESFKFNKLEYVLEEADCWDGDETDKIPC